MNIVLGSAQFGLDYGISNTKGISSEDEVVKILQYANSAGIDTIDSASQYGKSESVIGRCVDQNSNWNIITKTPSFKGGSINTSDATHLSDKFKLSLENLNLKKNYGLLIHSCDDLFKPGGDLLFREMEKLKSKGLVSNIGVSLYTSNQIDNILDRYNVDIIQLPINILDQNLYTNGWLKKIKNSNYI